MATPNPCLALRDVSRCGTRGGFSVSHYITVGAGPGGGPHVRVFDGQTGEVIRDFFAFNPAFRGGVFVAAGDVNNDGVDDIITGADSGGTPHIRVFSGTDGTVFYNFLAFSPSFSGGVRVASGDVNGDGRDDIIAAAGPGGGPHVRVFSTAAAVELMSFFAFDPAFTGGVYVSAGDLNGDGRTDIVVGAGIGGSPHVRAFNGLNATDELANFFAYGDTFTGGVRVSAHDSNGDRIAEIITAPGSGRNPEVKRFDSNTFDEMDRFFAFDETFDGGAFVG